MRKSPWTRVRAVGAGAPRDHRVLAEPAERQLERRVRLQRDRAEDLLVALDLERGGRFVRRRRGQRREPCFSTGIAWICAPAAARAAPAALRARARTRPRAADAAGASRPRRGARRTTRRRRPTRRRSRAAPARARPRRRPPFMSWNSIGRESSLGAPRTSRWRISGSVSVDPSARSSVASSDHVSREAPPVRRRRSATRTDVAPVWRAMKVSMPRAKSASSGHARIHHRGTERPQQALHLFSPPPPPPLPGKILTRPDPGTPTGRSRRRRRSGTPSCLRRRAWSCRRGGCAAG